MRSLMLHSGPFKCSVLLRRPLLASGLNAWIFFFFFKFLAPNSINMAVCWCKQSVHWVATHSPRQQAEGWPAGHSTRCECPKHAGGMGDAGGPTFVEPSAGDSSKSKHTSRLPEAGLDQRE